MQEPTEAEMIRALGTKVDLLTETINRLSTMMGGYVTEERYKAEMVLRDHKHDQLAQQVKESGARTANAVRLALSSFIAPIIVGVVIWLLSGGK